MPVLERGPGVCDLGAQRGQLAGGGGHDIMGTVLDGHRGWGLVLQPGGGLGGWQRQVVRGFQGCWAALGPTGVGL